MGRNEFGRPRRRILALDDIDKFLGDLGFISKKMTQEWRHVMAWGDYEGKKAVFKLGSTLATSRMTRNEFNWNEAVHLTPEESRQNFTVPKNYVHGEYGKLFYFIAEQFNSPLLKGDFKSMEMGKKIPLIAQATREVETLWFPEDCEFVKSQTKKKRKPGQKSGLLKSAEEWARQVPLDLDKFLQVIEDAGELSTCLGHGDWVLRQMYDVDGKIG